MEVRFSLTKSINDSHSAALKHNSAALNHHSTPKTSLNSKNITQLQKHHSTPNFIDMVF